ncbi:MAG: peroxiredoxin [Bacteroidota bacterium]|nr:peroxiredoxin [Bacteroidota bacterium]
MLNIGSSAPDFTLVDTKLTPRSLGEFAGRTLVIAFYPGAFTSVCTKEMCAFRDSMARFNEMNAQVVGISVDGPFANAEFAAKHLLNFPLLSDYDRSATRAYGVELKDFAGLKGYTAAQRSVFVLDGNGVIRYAWIAENPSLEPDYEAIRRVVTELT